MYDAAVFAHPACRDHHEWPFATVQCDAFVLRPDVSQAFEIEDVIVSVSMWHGRGVHRVGMRSMDFRQSRGQRAVDKYGHAAHDIFVTQFVQSMHQHLSAAQTEGWHDDFTLSPKRLADDSLQFRFDIPGFRMQLLSVS